MKALEVIGILVMVVGVAYSQTTNLTFPDTLQIGAATASYQIEGAWNVSDKAEGVWDYFTHHYPEKMDDGSNGDVACNSYYKYKEDVALAKAMGLVFYRFSISWPRLLPTGLGNKISADGLQYYLNLTQELIANDIEPIITIYHWDHPQVIEELGGWTNELIVDYFVGFAKVLFDNLGPYVKTWVTINEPVSFCEGGYLHGGRAPGKVLNAPGYHQCAVNVLKAHAAVWHLYDESYRESQGGEVGIDVICRGWFSSDTNNAELIERGYIYDCGYWMHPILIGDWPELVKTRAENYSISQGYSESYLPELSEYWIDYINGTADFFGMNHYTSGVPEELGSENLDSAFLFPESGIYNNVSAYYPTAATDWLFIAPEGLGLALRWIRDTYNNPKIYMFENGRPDYGESNDYDRIQYYYDYMKVLLEAIADGCDVQKYTIWSLIDNFEWAYGYTQLFGIHQVDFTDDERPRTRKLSAAWWQQNIETRTLQEVPTNDSLLSRGRSV